MSAHPKAAQAPASDSRLIITGDSDDLVEIEGSQQAEICVFDAPLYLLVSDGTLIYAQYGENPEDDIWRLRIVQAGTAASQHRGPVLDEYSERIELTSPGLRVFAATAEAAIIEQLLSGSLTVAELLEPARICARFLEQTDPSFEWVDAWDEIWCDAPNGVLPMRRVLAMRDAMAAAK